MTTGENLFLSKPIDSPVFYADSSLENKSAGTCDLIMLLERPAVQLALKERKTNRLLAFELLPASDKKAHWKTLLDDASEKSQLLKKFEFSKVIAGITTQQYTLVPEALFKAGDETNYFRKNFSGSNDLLIHAQHIPEFHLYTIFGTEPDFEKEINHLFQDPHLYHHSHALLTGLSMQKSSGKQFWLNVRRNKIDVIVSENKKLILLNTFPWETNEDVLYYTLFVCEQLEINPEKTPFTVTGEIENESALYLMLYKYIRDISIPNRPALLSSIPEEMPSHYYATLYNLALCE